MSSEQLGSGVNILKGDLAASFDILSGSAADYQDLGIARRFGGAAAAYSLRDIGAMNGPVVKVRRDVDGQGTDPEVDFSASQIDAGVLEDWVNGKLETTLPADVATASAAFSLRKVKASYSGNAVRIRRSSDNIEVDVAFDSDDKVSASSTITNVAEQGGEIGQTTDTTLGDFISGTDAFVHTWYDQTDNNDAIQTVAASQPKIAENGALLDYLNFDGNVFMDIGALLLNATDAHCFMLTSNIDRSVNETHFMSNRVGAKGYNFVHKSVDSGKLQINFIASGAIKSINQIIPQNSDYKQLIAFSRQTNSVEFFNNGASVADDGASQTYTTEIGTPNTSIGKQGSSPSANPNKKQRFYEIITFDSDQTDNRFKIESNINNYWGLYNDANETSDSAFQFEGERSGGVSVADGVNGFTLDTQTAAAFAGIQLNQKVTSGDSIFVSCNITNLTAGSATASPRCQLRKGTLGGTDGSNFVNLALGFNAFTLTSTDSDVEFVSFSEGDDNTIFTLTDFKVSRIARDGKVQTWYDQSGSGQNATQSSANFQPFIIRYGGQIKLPNSKTPSIGLLRSGSLNSILSISSKITTEPYTFFGTGFAYNNRSTAFFSEAATYQRPALLAGSTSGTGSVRYRPDNLTDTGSITSGINVHTDFYITAYSGENGGDDYILRFNGSQVATGARAEAGDGIQVIGSFDSGTTNITCIESWVLYTSDLTSDAADIENQLAQPIGLI